jgi:transposase-like protein
MHLGSSIKAYRELWRRWTPPGCLAGDGDAAKLHDGYAHWAGPDQKEPLRIVRFRGRRCWCVVAVVPDLLLPGCSHPAEVRDRAVEAYVTGQGTYQEVATEVGVAKSTVWRWVFEAGSRGEAWLEQVRALLRRLGLPDGPVAFRHELRALFLRRRVRRPGMLEALLLLEALLGWVERLRQALLRQGRGPLPAGLHAFGYHVLERLEAASARASP